MFVTLLMYDFSHPQRSDVEEQCLARVPKFKCYCAFWFYEYSFCFAFFSYNMLDSYAFYNHLFFQQHLQSIPLYIHTVFLFFLCFFFRSIFFSCKTFTVCFFFVHSLSLSISSSLYNPKYVEFFYLFFLFYVTYKYIIFLIEKVSCSSANSIKEKQEKITIVCEMYLRCWRV